MNEADKFLDEAEIQYYMISSKPFYIEKLKPFFKDFDKHIPLYKEISEQLGLIGEEYYAYKKAIAYSINSNIQNLIVTKAGKTKADNRIHLLFKSGAGRGKTSVKNAVREFTKDFCKIHDIPATAHPEQLIGKRVKKGKEFIDVKGYLGGDIIFEDECQKVINEDDQNQAMIMRIKRIAMDNYGDNLIEKKLVDNIEGLEYFSPSSFFSFMHNVTFSPRFFDTGTFRRYFCFSAAQNEPYNITDSTAALFMDDIVPEIKEKILEHRRNTSLILKRELNMICKTVIAEHVQAWLKFVLSHENKTVRLLGEKQFFSIKEHFIKNVIILSAAKNEKKVTETTTRQACLDTIHFLLYTFKEYADNSKITISQDIWKTNNEYEASVLEWLWHNNCTNKENTKLSIKQCQNLIGDFFGVLDKQSRRIFNGMKQKALIKSWKGQHESKAWINFEPKTDGCILPKETVGNPLLFLMEFLKKEREKLVERGQR